MAIPYRNQLLRRPMAYSSSQILAGMREDIGSMRWSVLASRRIIEEAKEAIVWADKILLADRRNAGG